MTVQKYKPKSTPYGAGELLLKPTLRSDKAIRKSKDVIGRSNQLLSKAHQQLEDAREALVISRKIRRVRRP